MCVCVILIVLNPPASPSCTPKMIPISWVLVADSCAMPTGYPERQAGFENYQGVCQLEIAVIAHLC